MRKSKEHIPQRFFHNYKLGHNVSEAKQKICPIYSLGCCLYKTKCSWFEPFPNGDFSLEDEQKSVYPIEIDLNE